MGEVSAATGGCLSLILMTFFFVSPILAVIGWIGWAISDPTSGGWLFIAIVSTLGAIAVIARFVKDQKSTSGY